MARNAFRTGAKINFSDKKFWRLWALKPSKSIQPPHVELEASKKKFPQRKSVDMHKILLPKIF